MIIYKAESTWDNGQICANGFKALGLHATLEKAKAACVADGALPTWKPYRWRSGAIEACGADGWKQYVIDEVVVEE